MKISFRMWTGKEFPRSLSDCIIKFKIMTRVLIVRIRENEQLWIIPTVASCSKSSWIESKSDIRISGGKRRRIDRKHEPIEPSYDSGWKAFNDAASRWFDPQIKSIHAGNCSLTIALSRAFQESHQHTCWRVSFQKKKKHLHVYSKQ